MPEVSIRKATKDDGDAAYKIVSEYYEAARVIARDSKEHFLRHYFVDRAGVWLASINGGIVGCIALRELTEFPGSGEIKRMYVQPTHRGTASPKNCSTRLNDSPQEPAYEWLYLDSAPGMDTAVRFYQRNGFQPCAPYNHNPQANIYLRKKIS